MRHSMNIEVSIFTIDIRASRLKRSVFFLNWIDFYVNVLIKFERGASLSLVPSAACNSPGTKLHKKEAKLKKNELPFRNALLLHIKLFQKEIAVHRSRRLFHKRLQVILFSCWISSYNEHKGHKLLYKIYFWVMLTKRKNKNVFLFKSVFGK